MTDINLWRLAYDDVSFDFGLHDTGYPFTKQVVIGPPGSAYGDVDHPLSDGVVFGVDLTRGRKLSFAGAHFDLVVAGEDPWERRLDQGQDIEQFWAAENLRSRGDGAVARLTNVARGRAVYGRPRAYAADLEKMRGSWTTWTGEFHTVDDRFYGDPQDVSTSGPVIHDGSDPSTPTIGGFNNGTRNAYVKLEFENTGGSGAHLTDPMLWAYDSDGDVLWKAGIAGDLTDFNDDLGTTHGDAVIDARPWALSAIASTQNRPGAFRGNRLAELFLPPQEVVGFGFGATHGAGTVTVTWDDTYGSL